MSIQDQLKVFEKTDKFKKLVAEKMKSDPNLGSELKGHSYHETAAKFGDRMRELLQKEIIGIKSSRTNESFLDHIIVSEEFITGTGWTVKVSFDDEFMHRESLDPEDYPAGAELNVLFNEGYDARAYAFGVWNGEAIYSKKQRDALYFVQKSVDKFNSEQKGKAVAQYNSKYSGGTL